LRIDKIDRRAIALQLGRLTADSGPVQANRTRSSLVTFLTWCAGEGFIDANPATFTNKNPEQTRDRVLSEAELRKIWHAAPASDFGDIIRLLMLTAQREREISELAWHEIDFDRAVITLPPARVKNGRRHTIPLSDAAAEILKGRTPRPDRELVFGLGQGGFSNWGKAK
jgi:integrase